VIHLSSVGVTGYQYSNAKLIVDELSECYPKNKYEKTKLVSEELLLTAQQRIGFELDIIRPTNVFGEAHPYNALLSFMSYVKSGKPFIYSKNAQVNYLYVKDLTQLIITLLNENHQKGIINIGQSIELIDFYRQVQSVLQSKNLEIILPTVFIKLMNKLNFGKIETISNQVIYNDAKLLHFYKYTYGEFEGLKRTITYYKQLKLI
jgi:nucleoside-diphosphate-sugar epimerase